MKKIFLFVPTMLLMTTFVSPNAKGQTPSNCNLFQSSGTSTVVTVENLANDNAAYSGITYRTYNDYLSHV